MLLFRMIGKGFSKLFKGIGYFGKYFGKYSGIVPVGLFIVTQFFIDFFSTKSFPFAFSNMGKTLFSAELVINEKVHMAIANAQGYNLIDFFQILISLYILYALVSFLVRLQVGVGGAQAKWGAFVIAIIIVGIIEVSAIAVIDGVFGFVPLWDGVIFLLMNLEPVLTSIFGYETIVRPVVNNTINGTNNTMMVICSFFGRKDI